MERRSVETFAFCSLANLPLGVIPASANLGVLSITRADPLSSIYLVYLSSARPPVSPLACLPFSSLLAAGAGTDRTAQRERVIAASAGYLASQVKRGSDRELQVLLSFAPSKQSGLEIGLGPEVAKITITKRLLSMCIISSCQTSS